MIKCESGMAACPKSLDICCAMCNERTECEVVCESVPEKCPDAKMISGEITQFQAAAPEAIQQITQLVIVKKQLEEEEKRLKAALVAAMEKYGVKSFENDQIKMTYVAPTSRSTIDSANLKKDYPGLLEQYTKTSGVAASVRIAVK